MYIVLKKEKICIWVAIVFTLLLLNTKCPVLANSVDPDQLTSEEANWSGSALFVIKYVNFYQKPRSSILIGWKLEVGVASLFSKAKINTRLPTLQIWAQLFKALLA